jgi:hypothetical protein
MTGWIRLWILLSVIWLAVVTTFIAVSLNEFDGKANGPWISHRLSESSQQFYKRRGNSDEGPSYVVPVTLVSGTVKEVSFSVLSSSGLESIERKIQSLAASEGTSVSAEEMSRFLSAVRLENKRAENAAKEYAIELAKYSVEQRESRRDLITFGGLLGAVPPIFVLVLGYGIAWVRRGFIAR